MGVYLDRGVCPSCFVIKAIVKTKTNLGTKLKLLDQFPSLLSLGTGRGGCQLNYLIFFSSCLHTINIHGLNCVQNTDM